MTKRFAAAIVLGMSTSLNPLPVFAQQATPTAQAAEQLRWIQVEALPNQAGAEERIREYAAQMEGVNGFQVGAKWFAVILGPYTPDAAELQMRTLKRSGLIPRDSFIARSNQLRQQFWPAGADLLGTASATPIAPSEAEPTPAATQEVAEVATPEPAAPAEPEPPREETRREALRSERDLDRDQRKDLQTALQWEGFYTARIDGAFGAGTRRSMAAWQTDRGYDATGVLTTNQRAELLAHYQAVIDGLGLAAYTDDAAGIEVPLPSAVVAFDRHEAPFAHFKNTDGSGARVVLISQTGDQDTLFGLYDILQTLEIVPDEGARKRGQNSFTIEGANDKIHSFTEVKLSNGTVKGFMLIWPQGDDKRRTMVLDAMRNGFTPLGETALADNAGLDQTTQSLDLLSGLEIRRPTQSRSGFFVNGKGMILTTAEAVASCTTITVNEDYKATVVATDEATGLALLKPSEPLAPISHAAFQTTNPRLNTEVAAAGYSFEGRLNAPSLNFGLLAELKGLNGEDGLARLTLAALPGDAGGPVLDGGGAVVGMLLPAQAPSGRSLPADVSFARQSTNVTDFLSQNGVTPETTDIVASMDPIDLSALAADMTVLVSCWE